ncbi:LPS export ABC transporter periplasmic protein LptC [Corticimicrobacter populi]|uniref:LPS export ABC transporter periplasmic protein LptC n=1 Tax=Corticimicrobacter populi TaxID=2175229 RepID=A0A2V1K1A8_9BURK|nr:LPS export ABC transporter periplasmic protein LptC [Corticimicrobacter populi]PWF23876.1 LPS export ABC transporter periplasmic protein LptC [Corticimicrobacter populi]
MKDRLPALTSFALLIALAGGTWWAAEYAQQAVPLDPPRRVTHEPDAWASDFVLLRTDTGGIPVNRLAGTHMQHFPDDDSYEVDHPVATGLRATNPVTIGTARTAVMDQGGARITLRGDAHLRRLADAERAELNLYSPELIILPDADKAYTDLPTLVEQGRSQMRGKGMQYDNSSRILTVDSASQVDIAPNTLPQREAESRAAQP